MKHHLRRYAAGALAAGALAAVGVVALPAGTSDWEPVTYGLTVSPEQILPATVSTTAPARVVTTTIDERGRPVIKVQEATTKKAATRLVEDAQKDDETVAVEVDAPVYALDVPAGSDAYRAQQWDFAKLRIADAWPRSTGEGVTVAVIDTGVDAKHPDLAANVLSGYDAIAGKAGVSTDGNGHGTHVAGTIAAVTGNNTGVSAVAPDVKILPIKVLDATGRGNMSDTAEAIVWAADHGAQVINMSLGATSKVAAVSNAISYARSKGVTVVAAAGNSRLLGSPVSYPGADEGVIAVAATDSADKFAAFSNAGAYVDVAAPGVAILSTYPTALGSYAQLNGTSMASPHVAAVAALLKSYAAQLTPDQIESALEKTAVDLGKAGFDTDYGNGRIDPVAALAAVTPAPTKPVTTAPATTKPTTTPPTTAPTTPATTAPTTAPPPTTPATKPPTAAPTKAPTATPTPTPTKAKVKPLLTSTVISRDVAYNTTASVTFTVRVSGKPWTAKPASLCVTEGLATSGIKKKSETCTDVTTSSTGAVTLARPATTSFQAYLKVAESDTTTAATSPTATFKARATVTATRTAKGTLTVRLSCTPGQSVQVQQYYRGTWQTVGDFPAATTVIVKGLAPGLRYRVVVPDTATVAGATSGSVTV